MAGQVAAAACAGATAGASRRRLPAAAPAARAGYEAASRKTAGRCPSGVAALPRAQRALGLWAVFLASAVAFDIDAHDAIGQTAASAMDPTAIKNVKRLLGGQDASDVAGWGHQVDDTYPGMARLHFQVHDDSVHPFCEDLENRQPRCDDNICLLTSIKHFYGKILADEGRKTDYPAIDYEKAHPGVKFSDADAVKMLINLLGDLHQPMHVGYAGDDNGHNVKVKFRGKEVTLYEVWDKLISETVRQEESGFWYGGWTHVRAVYEDYQKDLASWKQDGSTKSFDRWMDETVKFACEKVYKHPATGKWIAGPKAEAGQVMEIDEGAYRTWKDAWLKQILVAGARTAIVLNDILDAGGAKKLDQSSKVKTHADEEKEKQRAEWDRERAETMKQANAVRPSRLNFPIFCTNLMIALVTVPTFIAIVNYGLNPSVYVALLQSLLETDKGGAGGGGGGGGGRSAKRFE